MYWLFVLGDREVLDLSVAEHQALQDGETNEPSTPSTAGPSGTGGASSSGAPPTPNAAPPAAVARTPTVDGDDNIIDHMIDRLQREQDQRIAAEGGEPLLSPNPHSAGLQSPSFSNDHDYTAAGPSSTSGSHHHRRRSLSPRSPRAGTSNTPSTSTAPASKPSASGKYSCGWKKTLYCLL